MQTTDIFERLRNGETILPTDPEAYKMQLIRLFPENFKIKKLQNWSFIFFN